MDINQKLKDPAIVDSLTLTRAIGMGNLGIIAPHKVKYYNRYNISWLSDQIDNNVSLRYITFWRADKGVENNIFSQWYQGPPIIINGRQYVTAEQYMMSEKALLFKDLYSYTKIMEQPDPEICKKLGKEVKGFEQALWDASFREIIFHGNLGKLQSDIEFVDALLQTGNAVLIEASPYDDIYGAGMRKKDLLNPDGSLKVHPKHWHKKNSTKQAENNLGFVLMGLRNLFWEMMGYKYEPGMKEEICIRH